MAGSLGSAANPPTISYLGDIQGTTTNNSPAAGCVGEVIQSAVGSTNFPTSGQFGDLTSISLTAGDWLVSTNAVLVGGGATITIVHIGISTTSGNSNTGLTLGDNDISDAQTHTTITGTYGNMAVVDYHIQLSATTTVYLKYSATYTVSTPAAHGRITANRLR